MNKLGHTIKNTEMFLVELDLVTLVDGMSDEDLRSFVELHEDPINNEQIELYIFACFVLFVKAKSREHLEQAVQRTEGWVAITNLGDPDRARRLQLLDMMSDRIYEFDNSPQESLSMRVEDPFHLGHVQTFTEESADLPYLIFTIPPGRIRKAVFQIWSHDHGWSDDWRNHNTFNASHTWFEVRYKGTDKHLAPFVIQQNVHFSGQLRHHTIIWEAGKQSKPGIDDFMSGLDMGDEVEIYPKAKFDGWVNCVHGIRVELENLDDDNQAHRFEFDKGGIDKMDRIDELTEPIKGVNAAEMPADAISQKNIDQAGHLNSLANWLGSRFQSTGSMEDLNNVVKVATMTIDATSEDHPARASRLTDLGIKLYYRYTRTGNVDDLDAAISKAEEAVASTSLNHTERAMYINNLGTWLADRYAMTGNADDLDTAISKAEEAVALAPLNHSERAMYLSNLGNKLANRYTRTGNADDLDAAISKAEEAVASTPLNHTERAMYINNLGNKLADRYTRTGNADDLDAAISKAEEAVASTPSNHSNWTTYLSNLGNSLADRYAMTGNVDDLDAAIAKAEEAVASTPLNHSNQASFLNSLGSKLSDRYTRTQNVEDERTALDAWIKSSQCPSSAPLPRIQGARQALRVLTREGDWDKARSISETAVSLLPRTCGRFLSRDDQQHAVRQTAGLAADACSVSLRKGDVEEALRRIEFGRGLILGYLIDSQSDLSELERIHPRLSEEYEQLRFIAFRRADSDEPATREQLARERQEASRQLEDCEHRIRQEPGFEHFLLPPPTEELTKCASEGPIIIVNATDIGSDAILVLPSGTRAITLPELISQAPRAFQEALRRSRAISDSDFRRDMESDVRLEHSTEFLSWLWLSCVKPVLQELACYDPSPPSNKIQRMWWIGTGAASSLPFHAACQYHDSHTIEAESCLDQTIPSYTPTIKALRNARKRSLAVGKLDSKDTSLLVVTMPTTPGQSALDGVAREEKVITETAKHAYTIRPPLQHPTADEVLRSIRESEIAHFACHGCSDLIDPSKSHLLFQKSTDLGPIVDRLTVSTLLSATAQGRAWIAYLSACSTAEIRVKSLTDESIHMASAFQVAGFAHVIGSLWPADDEVCVRVAELFYKFLVRWKGTTDANRAVAAALREAVLHIRKEHASRPSVWALYVHLGA